MGNIYYQGESTDDTRLDGYNVVTGNVDVIGAANVDFLRCVTEVQGVISIRGTSITDLAGLGQLTEAGGISVTDNPNLVVFRGLESLATLGDLTVSANPALIRIEGPANVTRLGDSSSKDGALQIRGNDVLTQLTGFDKLVAIEGNLVVRENPLLDDISGLFGLKALGGRFVMASNPELCISQVNKVGAGLVQWTMMGEGETSGNKEGC